MTTLFSKLLLAIFCALLMASSPRNSTWADSMVRDQSNAILVARIHERKAIIETKPPSAQAMQFTHVDPSGRVQGADHAGDTGIRPASFGIVSNNADRFTSKENTETDAGNDSAVPFFLMTGVALIAARIAVSFQLQKAKNLAAGTMSDAQPTV